MSSSLRETVVPARVAGDAVLVVRAPKERRIPVREVIGYRPLVRALAVRDLKARYKQAALGPAWVVFQPLALLVAFSIGFKSVANVKTAGVPYLLFALVGLSVWTYFQAVAMAATGSIVNNYALVRWTACPRLALPLATLVSCLPSLAITSIAALAATAISGYLWLGVLSVPVMLVWLLVLTGSVAIFLAAISVRARDVISALPFLLQVMLFLAPVAYSTSELSSKLRVLISLNPLTGLIDGWRWALLGVAPNMTSVAVSIVVTSLMVVVAWRTFVGVEVLMADEI